MPTLELIAAVLGLISVALTVRQHIFCWPTGLAMVLLYIHVFYEAKLYSDMLLQVVFVVLQIYGWYAWLHGGRDRSPLAVTRLRPLHGVCWLVAGAVGTSLLGSAMSAWTDASYPFLDAGITVASLIAQWLMARKFLESWLVWIAVDIASIGLFSVKSLYPTLVLYCIFLVMAVWGWWSWRAHASK